MNIVVVEDQEDLSLLITKRLEEAGITCERAMTGEQALDTINPDLHDLVVLDRGLPDMEGLDILKILREEGVKIPVLVLTAMDELGDKVEGLNSGADDYLVKPFEMDELIARIHALYRRPTDAISLVWRCGNVEFTPSESKILVGDKQLDLSLKEKQALERLMRLPGKVVSKDSLHSALHGLGEEVSENSIEVAIHRLRKKLSDMNANAEIKTLRGIGYVMKEKDKDL